MDCNRECTVHHYQTPPTDHQALFCLASLLLRRRHQYQLYASTVSCNHLHHHQPVKSRLHSRNSFVSTSHPLLCKPAEARITKWQNQWEPTQSNLKKYDIHPKEQLPSGDTLPWRTWRTANRMRSGQAATSAAKYLRGYRENKHCMCGAATCDLNHIMASCTHFGEIPSKDDIAEMEGRAVRWMSAVADTI